MQLPPLQSKSLVQPTQLPVLSSHRPELQLASLRHCTHTPPGAHSRLSTAHGFTQSGVHRLVASAEILDAIDTDVNYTIGAEYSFSGIVFLRAGKRWVNEANDTGFRTGSYGLSWGGGLSIPLGGGRRIGFDYAYTNMGELNNIQIYSFALGF